MKPLLFGLGFGAGFFGLCLIIGSRIIFNDPCLTAEDYAGA